jgi:hypothetical protein
MRLFQFDPFRHLTRDQATVRGLRSQATGVDLTFTAPRRQVVPRAIKGDFTKVYFGDSEALDADQDGLTTQA